MKFLGYEAPLGISVSGHSADAVHRFAEAGFTHFEIGIPRSAGTESPVRSPEEDAKAACRGQEEQLVSLKQPMADAVEKENLRVWSVHLPFGRGWDIAHYLESERDAVVDSLKRVIRLTAAWHPRVYVLHGCLEPVAPEQRPVRIARSIRSLRELDEYAQHFGARIALENLPRSCLANSSVETRAMMAAASVPICFDVNHLLGDTHAAFLDALADQIVTTHLSDYDGIDERHWLPGEGIVPWRELFLRLMDSGYRGPFLFELRVGEKGPYEPDEILRCFERALQK